MFQIGDKIVHPMHGAGVIDDIVDRKVNGELRRFYCMKLPMGDMVVMIPVDACDTIGVRPVMTPEAAEAVVAAIPGLQVNMTQNWNRRYQENMSRLKSGDLMEVAAVVKGLSQRESARGLSTGERKMLHTAKQILVSELVLANTLTYEEAEEHLNQALN
jgi:CarD family transcriptional regulator